MKLLMWFFMVDILLVLCQDSTSKPNWIISRQKRNHEFDITVPKKEMIRKIKPIVVIPVRDINKQRQLNIKFNKDYMTKNTSLPAKNQSNNSTIALNPLERVINARLRIINALNKNSNLTLIENKINDVDNTTFKEQKKYSKDKVVNARKRILNALNPKNNITDIETNIKLVKESNDLDEQKVIKEIKEEPIKPEEVNKDNTTSKEHILEKGEQNTTHVEENNIDKERSETIPKVEDNKIESNTSKVTSAEKKENNGEIRKTDKFATGTKNKNSKIRSKTNKLKKERELIKDLLKQGKKSEVVTPNHYDRMYTKSLGPFFYIEKDRKNRNKKNKVDKNGSDESKEVIDETKNESTKTKVVNKDYVEKLLKIGKLPSVAVLSKTEAEPVSDNIKPKMKDNDCEKDNAVNTPENAVNPTLKAPVDGIDLKTGPTQEVAASKTEPNDSTSVYIENQSFDEIYENFDKIPANYDSTVRNAPGYTEYMISPKLNQHNQLYYDCSLPYTAHVYNNPGKYVTSNAVYDVPYKNQPSYKGNVPVSNKFNQPWHNQEHRLINMGNGRLRRCWKNTNVYFVKNGSLLTLPVNNPLIYKLPVAQPLVTPNSYMNQQTYNYSQR